MRTTDAAGAHEASQDAVRRMIELLAHRLPGVSERTAARARAEIPQYAVLSLEELREGIDRDLLLAVQALVEDRDFTDEDRAVLSMIGDTRAAQGLPLEGMLRTYRITVDEIFNELWAAVEEGLLEAREVMDLSRKVWSYTGPLMDLATTAYRHRELEQALADNDRRTGLVHELLLDPSAATGPALVSLGLDPLRPHLAFRARTPEGGTAELLSTLKLPGVLDGGVVVPYEGDLVGLATRRPGVTDLRGARIGVGPAGPPAALPASFAAATRTLDTATAFGLAGAFALDDLPLHALARAEDELGELLRRRCVAPVLDVGAGAEDVLATVRAFLAHGRNAEAAGAALGVHPNTVRNRLHRYEEVTGLSLRELDDLLLVRLALLRHELIGG